MKNEKKLIIWTIILNLLIIVAAGHGGGFLALIEIFWLPHGYWIGTEDFSFSVTSAYDKTLGLTAILSLIGQVALIISLLTKTNNKSLPIVIGILMLWLGFFYLIRLLFIDSASQVGFVTGLPFLIVSGILLFKIFRRKVIIGSRAGG